MFHIGKRSRGWVLCKGTFLGFSAHCPIVDGCRDAVVSLPHALFLFFSTTQVKQATHAVTGDTVAVKILDKAKMIQQGMKERVEREIQILQTLGRHPHVSYLYEVIESPTETILVLENIGGGELYDFIMETGPLGEAVARRLFQQLVEGIDYCHSRGIVHRDLKPENLLLDSNHNLKITDFGLSKRVRSGGVLQTTCGTPHYTAPEILNRQKYDGRQVDVWSCGIILYALLTGGVPFYDDSTPRLFEKIRSGDYEMPRHLTKDVQDLIRRILQVDPATRITIEEIRQHPWFQQDKLPKEVHNHEVDDGVIELAASTAKEASQILVDEIPEAPKLLHELSCTRELMMDGKVQKSHRSKQEDRKQKMWLPWELIKSLANYG